jgi:hypothetical protein
VIRKIRSFRLDISGAANPANNGQFPVLGFDGDAAIIDNAAGVLGADAGVTWTVRKRDRHDNVRDGFGRAFCSRGYRCSSGRPTGRTRHMFVIMLPFGATASIESAAREMLRQKKAGGVKALVERRMTP